MTGRRSLGWAYNQAAKTKAAEALERSYRGAAATAERSRSEAAAAAETSCRARGALERALMSTQGLSQAHSPRRGLRRAGVAEVLGR